MWYPMERVRPATQPAGTQLAGEGEGAVAEREPLAGTPGPASATTRLRDIVERNAFVVFVLTVWAAWHAVLERGALVSDGWYSLVAGRAVSRSGIPHHDTLTVLARGRAWVDQQWLAHLGLYGLWVAGGWALALLSVVAFYAAAFAVAAMAARLLGASDRSAAVIAIPCFLTGLPNTVLRAQIPAYLLFALVLLLLLTDDRRPSRRVFLVFPLLALWANVHGSVVLGAGLVALRGATLAVTRLRARDPAGEWLPRAGALLGLPWLCTLVSPYGLALPGYYNRFLGDSTLEHILTEWVPSTLRSQPLFFGLLLAGLWLVFRERATLTPFAQLAFVCSGIAGLLAVRNIVWFALVAAATLPRSLDVLWPPAEAQRRPRINVALALAGVATAVAAAAATASHSRAWFEHDYPQGAAAAVAAAARSDPKLLVFANERYADWLIFEDPQLAGRVAYDARFELLTSGELAALFAFRTEHGLDWQRAARGYGVLVLDPLSDGGAIELFEHRRGTRLLFSDRNVVVLRLAPVGAGR
jgi:hypothetical protein